MQRCANRDAPMCGAIESCDSQKFHYGEKAPEPNGTYLSIFGDGTELLCGSELARDIRRNREQARSHKVLKR